jgi:molybdate transport system permease protein
VGGLLARVPWPDVWELITAPDSLTALRLSLTTATVSTVVCVLLGVPLGLVLARTEARPLRLVRALVLLPVVLPPVVGGLALLATFGRRGILAAPMAATGIDIAFTTAAVVAAQVFVAMPFVVMGVESAARTHGTGFETAAAMLGARPSRILTAVTLPLLLPAIASSAVLSFARALGEFGATLTFAGSLAGTTRTLPLEIYLRRETDPDAALAVSLLLVAIALIVVVTVHSLPGRPPRRHPAAAPSETAPQSAPASSPPLPSRSAPPRLDVSFTAPERGVSVSFAVAPGETLALVGPNGVGKSTSLAVVAGLLVPSSATVRAGSRTLTRTGDGPGVIDVPPHRRGVTLLLQDPRLFPHLTAVGNVAFGLRTAGITGRDATRQAQRMLDELGIGDLARSRPHALSGGQRARVALARALATDPQVVLLDEPTAALDAYAAPVIRSLLARTLADRTCILVSHDPEDVRALAGRFVRLQRD